MRLPKPFWICYGLFLAFWPGHAQGDDLDDTRPGRRIFTTITRKMGDLGGRFFGQVPDPARSRHYYVAAESAYWDYAPLGRDPICGKAFPDSVLKNRQGPKTRYV